MFDVTAVVAGNGAFTFALVSSSCDYAVFSSREGSSPPQLVVEYNPSGVERVAEVDNIPTATPTPEPTATATSAPAPMATAELVTPTATATPTLSIVDQFETGDSATRSDINGLIVQQDLVADGRWAARAPSNGTRRDEGTAASVVRVFDEPRDNLFVHVVFNVAAIGDSAANLMTVQTRNGRDVLSALVTEDRQLAIQVSRGGAETELVPVTFGEWHRLQLQVAVVGTRSLVEVWYDGTLIFRETVRTEPGELEAIRLGDTATDRTFDIAYDDLAIDDECMTPVQSTSRLKRSRLSSQRSH